MLAAPLCHVVRSGSARQSGQVLTRRAELIRLRHLAWAGLGRYPLAAGRLTFVAHGENTTFRHEGADGRHLVRVHRPQRHGREVDSEAAVGSELMWLQALRRDTGLAVPRPVLARDGALTVTVNSADVARVCSVLRWMDGRVHENSPRPVHLHQLGGAIAQLHRHADEWTPPPDFVRIRWDHATFFGNVMVYGDTPAARCWELLPREVRTRFRAVGGRVFDLMASAHDVGLIHADPHLGNALFHRGAVKLIDFDDCGTGPRVYDLAVAVWELRDRPDYPAFRDALLSGYHALRDLDVGHLDDYIALRQVAFGLWFTGTAQVNTAFAARLDRVHRWSLAMLDLLGIP